MVTYHFRSVLPVSDDLITIRTMIHADANAYVEGSEDPLIKQFAHLPLAHYTPQIVLDMIDNVIETGLEKGNLAILTIANKQNNAFLGSLVFFDISVDSAEVGYWIAPAQRGKKLATRSLQLASKIAAQLDIKALRARTVPDNIPSERALLAAGFINNAEPQTDITPDGKTEVVLSYFKTII